MVTLNDWTGIFYLLKANIPITAAQSCWTNKNISGVMMRQAANSIVTGRDTAGHLIINWTNLDAAAALAKANGKLWAVAIQWGPETPAFVAVQWFAFSHDTSPLPWDPVLIAVEKEFLAALGVRFGADPNLTIFMGGLGANSGIESYVAKTDADWDLIGDPDAAAKWIAGDQQIIDAYAAAFPRAALGMAAGVPFKGDSKSLNTLVDWAAAKYPNFGVYSFSMQETSNLGYPPNALVNKYATTHPCGFQAVAPSGDLATLTAALATGESLLKIGSGGHGQIQLYAVDCDNAALSALISKVNTELK